MHRNPFAALEPLEPRQLLSTVYLVDNVLNVMDGDYGPGEFTLREAIALANSTTDDDEVIRFASSIRGAVFELWGSPSGVPVGELAITRGLRISGYTETGEDAEITIDADFRSRIFNIDDGDAGRESPVVIENLSLWLGRTATSNGAAIRTLEPLTLDGCHITQSVAGIYAGHGSYASGGGVYAGPGSSLHIIGSTIRSSAAQVGGGVFARGAVSVIIEDSEISQNGATAAGAGVALRDLTGDALILQSTISTNRAVFRSNGGGIWANSPGTTLTVRNSTIARNTSGADEHETTGIGGGIYMVAGTLELQSTLVANNTRDSYGGRNGKPDDIRLLGDALLDPGSSNNLVADAGTSGGLIDGVNGNIVGTDARITAIGDYGGPTRTHALLPDSPAIDAGLADGALLTDQRGQPRTSGDATDIGAYERRLPVVTSLVASTDQIEQGDPLTLTAAGVDGEQIAEVRFYFDADGLGVGEPAQLIGSASVDNSGQSMLTLDSAGSLALLPGAGVCYAVAIDAFDGESEPLSTPLEVLFSLSSADDAATWIDVGSGDTSIALRNRAGDLILIGAQNADWIAQRLTSLADSGGAAVWTDASTQQQYAAGATDDGLVLLRRDGDEWTARNLSTELGVTEVWLALTQFDDPSGAPHLAVLSDTGSLVVFKANGDTADGEWAFTDISAQLDAQGMSTPTLTDITAYTTPWGALTIAGIDADGDIHGVWINPDRFASWRTVNLSAISGAPPVEGQLSAMVTPWCALHLTAVDARGRLIATWWAPGADGRWTTSNITAAASGDALRPGIITGFLSPWGTVHYAGIDADGEVVAYWWSPRTQHWQTASITAGLADSEPRPIAGLAGHTAADGTLNIVGASETDHLVRLWWRPDDPVWHAADLTDLAVRA